jgi:hypothetical protein
MLINKMRFKLSFLQDGDTENFEIAKSTFIVCRIGEDSYSVVLLHRIVPYVLPYNVFELDTELLEDLMITFEEMSNEKHFYLRILLSWFWSKLLGTPSLKSLIEGR